MGTFEDSSNTDNASAPGLTIVASLDDTQSFEGSQQLNITLQNLTPILSFQDVFAIVHSDDIRLFEVGKPPSNEIASFFSGEGADGLASLDSNDIYGFTALSTSTIAPGQYYNFSIPLSLPDRVSDESVADALDDLDASLTIIGRFTGEDLIFFAVNAMDVGDEVESESAAAYSLASGGFLTYHSGVVNDTITIFAANVVHVLSVAEDR